MGTEFPNSSRCITPKRLGLFAVALFAMGVLAATSSAGLPRGQRDNSRTPSAPRQKGKP